MSLPIDIYVRVSMVGGREGDSYLSPALQEERCRATIAAAGREVGDVFKDEDISGRKMSRPAFDRAMARIRSGESGGICVWKLSRFGRSTRGVLDGVQELEAHGATLMSTSESLDTSTPMGRFVLTIFAALTELESEQIRESWEATRQSLISRGVHSASRVPVGYDKAPNKLLVPNEYAPIVQEAFRMRAEDGASWRQIARYFVAEGLPGGKWPTTSVQAVIRNRVYLGEARFGDQVKVGAHPALVDERTFRLANRRQSGAPDRTPSGFLLGGGVVRCGIDGAGMVRGKGSSAGKAYEFLRCRNGGGSPPHPTIGAAKIEPYVRQAFVERVYEARDPDPATLLQPSMDKLVTTAADPELLARLEAVHLDARELDRMLEAGELSAAVYAKAMTVVERDREALEARIAQAPTGDHLRYRVGEDEHRFNALNALSDLDEQVPADLVPYARQLLVEVLGTITVHPGRAPVEQRVTFSRA